MAQGGVFRTGFVIVALCLTPTHDLRADVSGVVKDGSTGVGIAGAVVRLQATELSTTADAQGAFTLDVADGVSWVVVGAAKGYFNGSVLVDAPTSDVVIALDAVPQDDDPNYALITPQTCSLCHPDQYEQWLGSPMANAGFNTWVDDIYSGLGTEGGANGFVYLRDSKFAASNPASECASCHQPELWIEDPFSALADPRLPATPEVIHGVSCEVCHKIADVDVSKVNYPGIFPEAITFTRPKGPLFHPVQYGVLGDVDFEHASFMRASYQPQLVAEVCAACHQDANDIHEDHSFDGVISEPTYLEWADSPYADPKSPHYATCVNCHMPPSGHDQVCNALYPPLVRDPQTIRSHRILGTTPEFLENAVELSMHLSRNGPQVEINIDVANALTGHHVPTGVTVRNVILLVEAWREDDNEPLTFTAGQTVHELGGVGDPTQGYYAGLPGKFFAKVNHNADGVGPTFFTDATGILFDNRIPALATDSTTYSFALPGGGGAVQVRARLIYRRAFRFLVDAKGWMQDGHGNPLEDILPPHFGHLMEESQGQIVLVRGDADGDDDCDLPDFERLIECTTGPLQLLTDATCGVLDDNRDDRIDLLDFAGLQTAFNPAP